MIEGHETVIEEIEAAPASLRGYLAHAARQLLAEPRFIDALPGYLPGDAISQCRVPIIIKGWKQSRQVDGGGR